MLHKSRTFYTINMSRDLTSMILNKNRRKRIEVIETRIRKLFFPLKSLLCFPFSEEIREKR